MENENEKKVQCQYCAVNTDKRIVTKRYPLEDVTKELSEVDRNEGYKQFHCVNEIKIKYKGDNSLWNETTCENYMIIKVKKKVLGMN